MSATLGKRKTSDDDALESKATERFINLNPHAMNLIRKDGTRLNVPPATPGRALRVDYGQPDPLRYTWDGVQLLVDPDEGGKFCKLSDADKEWVLELDKKHGPACFLTSALCKPHLRGLLRFHGSSSFVAVNSVYPQHTERDDKGSITGIKALMESR